MGLETPVFSTGSCLGMSLFVMIMGAATRTVEACSTVPNEEDKYGDQGDDQDEGYDGDGAHEDE